MLDATNSRLAVVDDGDWTVQQNASHDGGLSRFVENIRQRRHIVMALTLAGAVVGLLATLVYITFRVSAFSASSEILISNTTLQLSGQDAVVTQVLVENSLVESAIELLRSGRVLGRVIDKLGSEEIERISPKPHVWPWDAAYWNPVSSDETRRQTTIALLRANTAVKRVGTSQIVEVRARALTAMDAASLTDEIARAFVREQYDANAVVSTSASLRERIKVLGPTARIISEAVPPVAQDPPRRAIAILLGIILGGAFGAAGGLGLIGFDRRLRGAEQLAAVTSAECFGYAPEVNPRTLESRITSSFPSDSAGSAPDATLAGLSGRGASSKPSAAAFNLRDMAPRRFLLRRVRRFENLLAPRAPDHMIDMDSYLRRSILRRVRSAVNERSTSVPHIIGVTSCQPREGKSMLAAGLARFVAREGAPVLLIDAGTPEMRGGPSQLQQQKPGLHELLRGTSAPDKVIQSDIYLNLDFLPRGKGPGNFDLLWSNLLQSVGGRRERSYKWIILDLPSLATAVDVRAAGQVFDELLIVVEWGRTTQGQLQKGLRALGPLQERIIGTVINKVPWASIDSETQLLLGRRPGCDDHRSEIADGEASYVQDKIQ